MNLLFKHITKPTHLLTLLIAFSLEEVSESKGIQRFASFSKRHFDTSRSPDRHRLDRSHRQIEQMLKKFTQDINQNQFQCQKNITVHKITIPSSFPRYFQTFLRREIIAILKNSRDMTYITCLLCERPTKILNEGQLEINWVGPNLAKKRAEWEALGVEDILTTTLIATDEELALMISCYDSRTHTLNASNVYRSEEKSKNPDRWREILRSTKRPQRNIDFVLGMGGANLPNTDNNDVGFANLHGGISQPLNSHTLRFSLLLHFYTAGSSFIGKTKGIESNAVSESQVPINEGGLTPYSKALSPTLSVGTRTAENDDIQSYLSATGGLLIVNGYTAGLVKVAWETYFKSHLQFNLQAVFIAPSEVTSEGITYPIKGGPGYEITLSYLL